MDRGRSALERMEAHLADCDWFAGDGLSLADIALVAYTRVAEDGGFDLEPLARVRAWIARVEAVLGIGEPSGLVAGRTGPGLLGLPDLRR